MALTHVKKSKHESSNASQRKAPISKDVQEAIDAAQAAQLRAIRLAQQDARDLRQGALTAGGTGHPTALHVGEAKMGVTPVVAPDADITDELARGGPAFGLLVSKVGDAVAEAQAQLDAGLVVTASALSQQMIDVIAVFEQKLDDDGQLVDGHPVVMKLPLINYITPPAYLWKSVHISADMKVSEFNTANGFNVQGKSQGFSVGAAATYSRLHGVGASGSIGYSFGSYAASGDSSTSTDQAAGSMHLDATLEPRPDMQIPKPVIVQKGPSLKLTAGPRVDVVPATPPGGSPPDPTGRAVDVTLTLLKVDSTALAGKSIDITLSDPFLSWTYKSTTDKTDSAGKVVITVSREGAQFDKTKPPAATVVHASFGYVNADVGINI
ncbi:MAG: hypothetical protein QOE90_3167 [Thermoplasmata archaeon]|nr:hypothetical protein [Thermoplasmata archaeon]